MPLHGAAAEALGGEQPHYYIRMQPALTGQISTEISLPACQGVVMYLSPTIFWPNPPNPPESVGRLPGTGQAGRMPFPGRDEG